MTKFFLRREMTNQQSHHLPFISSHKPKQFRFTELNMLIILLLQSLTFCEIDFDCLKAQTHKKHHTPKASFAICLDSNFIISTTKTDSSAATEYTNGPTHFSEALSFDSSRKTCRYSMKTKRQVGASYTYDSLKREFAKFGKLDTNRFIRGKTSLKYKFKEITAPCSFYARSYEEYSDAGEIIPAISYQYSCEYRKSKNDPCTAEGLIGKQNR